MQLQVLRRRLTPCLVECGQGLDEGRALIRGEPLDDRTDLGAAPAGDVLHGPTSLVREPQYGFAAVVGVGLPVRQPRGNEPVHHAHRGRGGDLEQFGEGDQLGGAARGEHHQHPELRQRHPLLDLCQRTRRHRYQQPRRREHRPGHRVHIIHVPHRGFTLGHSFFLPCFAPCGLTRPPGAAVMGQLRSSGHGTPSLVRRTSGRTRPLPLDCAKVTWAKAERGPAAGLLCGAPYRHRHRSRPPDFRRATMRQPFATEGRPQLPTGWRRLLARLPIRLYRAGLGPLFGKRLLLLHHTGRVTGLRRSVVLEVIAYERTGDTLSWTITSGFGPAAAWYQNLRRAPRTTIQFGSRHYCTTAHFLPRKTAPPSWPVTLPGIHGSPAACAPSWASRWTAAKRRSAGPGDPSRSYAWRPRPDSEPGDPSTAVPAARRWWFRWLLALARAPSAWTTAPAAPGSGCGGGV